MFELKLFNNFNSRCVFLVKEYCHMLYVFVTRSIYFVIHVCMFSLLTYMCMCVCVYVYIYIFYVKNKSD